MRLPVFAAPMFLVSGPELVVAACEAGIAGAFPTPNCRTAGSSQAAVHGQEPAVPPRSATSAARPAAIERLEAIEASVL